MTKLLTAQAAQLAGDRRGRVAAYNAMLERSGDATASACAGCTSRRGAAATTRRRCNMRCAPTRAQPAAWAGQAVLDDRTRRGDWAGALATVDSNAAAAPHRQADRPALARGDQDGDGRGGAGARSEGRAGAGAGGLPARAGPRSGGRALRPPGRRRPATTAARPERSKPPTPQTPHPDLAAAYLRVRHGDSTGGPARPRARARARSRRAIPKSMLTVGRAALEAHDLRAARAAIAPLLASEFPARPADPARLPADGGHRGGRRQSGRGARMAVSRRPRAAATRPGSPTA